MMPNRASITYDGIKAKVKEFEKNDYLEQCIQLRYWDEDAKDPERVHPAFSYYRPLVESLVKY